MAEPPRHYPPDWYPDPQDDTLLRWWDGTQWTVYILPATPAPAPVAEKLGYRASVEPLKRFIDLHPIRALIVLYCVALVLYFCSPILSSITCFVGTAGILVWRESLKKPRVADPEEDRHHPPAAYDNPE